MGSFGGDSQPVKETEAERVLADIAARKWADYKTRFQPKENELIRHVQDFGSQYDKQRSRDIASNSIQLSLGKPTFDRGEGEAGSGATLADAIQRTRVRGESTGMSEAAAVTGTEDRHREGLNRLVALGRNIESDGVAGLSRDASLAVAKERSEAIINQGEKNDLWRAIGTLGGAAAYSASRQPDPDRKATQA